MHLRTTHCLNALFQRRDASRVLNTRFARIVCSGSESRMVPTPAEAALYLESLNGAALRHSRFGLDSAGGAAIEFIMPGLIYDRPCFDRPCERAVDALTLKFFAPGQPAAVVLDERFLKGLVHYDALPDLHGPDLDGFIALLHQAGQSWHDLDFKPRLAHHTAHAVHA